MVVYERLVRNEWTGMAGHEERAGCEIRINRGGEVCEMRQVF